MEINLNMRTEITDHLGAVKEIDVHSDGSMFFARSEQMLVIYRLQDGKRLKGFYGSSGYDAAMFDAIGRMLIYQVDDRLYYWDLKAWRDRMTILGSLVEFRDVDMHPGVGLAADGGQDGKITVSKITADEYDPPEFILEGHTNYIEYLQFHPNGRILASSSADFAVKFWDLQNHSQISSQKLHNDFVTSIAFNADGSVMVTGDYSGKIKIWDVKIVE